MSASPATTAAVKPAGRPPRADASKVMIVFVTIVATLYFGREVLIPVTLALLLTFLLAPAVNWFRRIYFGRVPSVVLVVSLALAVLVGIGGVIGGQLRELASDLPNYTSTIEAKIATVKSDTLERFSHAINHAQPPRKNAAPPGAAAKLAQHQQGRPRRRQLPPGAPLRPGRC